MKKVLFAVIGLLMLTGSMAFADIRIIGADELKKTMDSKKQMVLVDSRTEKEYAQGHIPKAINISPEKVNEIGTLLPKAKSVLIVFYCRGAG